MQLGPERLQRRRMNTLSMQPDHSRRQQLQLMDDRPKIDWPGVQSHRNVRPGSTRVIDPKTYLNADSHSAIGEFEELEGGGCHRASCAYRKKCTNDQACV